MTIVAFLSRAGKYLVQMKVDNFRLAGYTPGTKDMCGWTPFLYRKIE